MSSSMYPKVFALSWVIPAISPNDIVIAEEVSPLTVNFTSPQDFWSSFTQCLGCPRQSSSPVQPQNL
ncbi:hypothetical protein XELAEV_18046472mg [Xenopus laevis]|uniref:Uncharacterized protein n=1 Tax=Xenopus laevis TaxID=8355 RepID=A0A974BTK1_XENLA|nr:hypothetical protein XELAEV_18046472mg [Xenopus laevis]